MSVRYVTNSEEETQKLGEQLAQRLKPGSVIAFTGDLGAGKTAFTRGLARGLGVEERVTSPTFTICNEYTGRSARLFHYDMYRISDESELGEVGFWEGLGKGVTLIEWSERIPGAIPPDAIRIEFRYAPEGREVIADDTLEF